MDFHYNVPRGMGLAAYRLGTPVPRAIPTRDRLARVVNEALVGRSMAPSEVDHAAQLPIGTTESLANGESRPLTEAMRAMSALNVHPVTLPPIDRRGFLL